MSTKSKTKLRKTENKVKKPKRMNKQTKDPRGVEADLNSSRHMKQNHIAPNSSRVQLWNNTHQKKNKIMISNRLLFFQKKKIKKWNNNFEDE